MRKERVIHIQKIYIILTHTGTVLSKIIKKWTKDEFSHVSIALDEDLEKMYSFGRLNPYNPFWGGFVQEGIHIGTFKRFKKTEAFVYSLEITHQQYMKIRNEIKKIKEHKKEYCFNVLGLLAVGFHRKFQPNHSFYCAEFVKYILEKADIKTNLPQIVKPEDFKYIKGYKVIYKGKLRKYNQKKIKEYIIKCIEISKKRTNEAM